MNWPRFASHFLIEVSKYFRLLIHQTHDWKQQRPEMMTQQRLMTMMQRMRRKGKQ